MAYPEPEVGLVISYSYLWADEAAQGYAEGRKTRPCAIVLVVEKNKGGPPRVVVAPITHSRPRDPDGAVEIPRAVKRHLGLDSEHSWVVVDDFNLFTWPGFDLRKIPGFDDRYSYGLIPPRFFQIIKLKFAERRASALSTARD